MVAIVVVVGLVVAAACSPQAAPATPPTTTVVDPLPQDPVGDDLVRLNQVQFLGSHNSYHLAPDPFIMWLLVTGARLFPQIAAGLGDPTELDYTHPPLTDQLAAGIRTFELDVWADPEGGRFANPKLPANFGYRDPLIPAGLEEPGFKVFHIVDVDYGTRCVSLRVCLEELRAWSDDHPGHLPIAINMELKDDPLPAPLIGTPVLRYDAGLLDALDEEIRAVLGDRLLTPDDVRGDAADLRTAITTEGWPTVAESRGRFLFFMDNQDLRPLYLEGHPSLEGRVMFTSWGEDEPDGAIIQVNDPGDGARIRGLVEAGYLVRTRADAGLVEARANDPSRRDTALASGAQIIHSDFPPNQPAPNGYVVTFGTRVAARCSPVLAAGCTPLAVVEPT
jgi:hypothetical protein